jgi:glyoxylase I family protein
MREDGGELWIQREGPTVFAPHSLDTDSAAARRSCSNFPVEDLDAMLAQLKGGGVEQVREMEEHAGIGRLAWVEDSEGNRIELWEPPKQ